MHSLLSSFRLASPPLMTTQILSYDVHLCLEKKTSDHRPALCPSTFGPPLPLRCAVVKVMSSVDGGQAGARGEDVLGEEGLHLPLALDVQGHRLPPVLGHELCRLLGHVDPSRCARALHARGHVDRVPEQAQPRLLDPNHPGHARTRVDPNPKLDRRPVINPPQSLCRRWRENKNGNFKVKTTK